MSELTPLQTRSVEHSWTQDLNAVVSKYFSARNCGLFCDRILGELGTGQIFGLPPAFLCHTESDWPGISPGKRITGSACCVLLGYTTVQLL